MSLLHAFLLRLLLQKLLVMARLLSAVQLLASHLGMEQFATADRIEDCLIM